MSFNEKLKLLRKEDNLTQEELSEKLNVSRQAITKWESGDGIPDIENLKQISILFNITIDELIKEEKIVEIKKKRSFVEELLIDHTKHFDINIGNKSELNIIPNIDEKVRIEIISYNLDDLEEKFKVKFDNLYNRLDISIKDKVKEDDIIVNLYLPEKYIDEIELSANLKTLNITNIYINKLEYDGELKYLNVKKSSGKISLNTTKCDVEARYDKLDGVLEVNTVNSTSRVSIPATSEYKTILKGFKNEFINANNNDDANSIIELNGVNSKLIIINND